MKTGISLETVVDIYQIANLLEQENLKEQAMQFMLKYEQYSTNVYYENKLPCKCNL